ncbi:MAG: acyloxyacyl hydrolase [Pseudomonadota bacterium]
MADGTFAVLMFLAGFADMQINHCGTDAGCLGATEMTPRMSVAAGEWVPRTADVQNELYLRYDLAHGIGPFGNAVGLSVAEGGETWVGYGQTYTYDTNGFFAELHAMPGLYFDNGGYDLGSVIEFRSGIELGYQSPSGWRYGVSYDHRSNTGIWSDRNPGVETVMLRVSVPLR